MADNSINVDMLDSGEVQGGGEYIDDVIDVDDDDDDEDNDDDDDDDDQPLVTAGRGGGLSSSKQTSFGGASNARPKKRMRVTKGNSEAGGTPGVQHGLSKGKPSDPLPTDLLLRAAGTEVREFVIANFRTGMPNLVRLDKDGDIHVRLTRQGERTVATRKDGLEADQKERLFLQSEAGLRRESRRSKLGFVTIRRRFQKEWKLELAPKEIADRLVEHRNMKIQQRLKRDRTGDGNSGSGVDGDENEKEDDEEEEEDAEVSDLKQMMTTYTGHFDGRGSSRYAVMVMNGKDRTVDVIPVGECSSFSFREDQTEKIKTVEEVEAIARKLRAKREKSQRMTNFSDKYLDAQMMRDLSMGDNSRLLEHPEFHNAGIKRGRTRGKDEFGGEEFDYEREFDNDDVLLVDRELMPKKEKEILMEAAESKRLFDKMIQDDSNKAETEVRSDGEGEGDDEDKGEGEDRTERSEDSGQRKQSDGETKTKVARVEEQRVGGNKVDVKSEHGVVGKGVVKVEASDLRSSSVVTGSIGGRASPSSTATGRSATPQMVDVSHLLPRPGTPLLAEHVRSVLLVLLKDRESIPFKEAARYFEHKSKEQKSNLVRIIKEVAVVTAQANKRNSIMISLKK